MPTFTYFDLHGRAAPCRMLLAHKGVEYEDRRLTQEAYGELKAQGVLDGLPVWEFDHMGSTKMLNESKALLRYLGKEYGYYPSDPKRAWVCDAYLDYMTPLMEKFSANFLNQDLGDEFKLKLKEEMLLLAEKIVKTMEDKRKFLCGSSITIADFMVFGILANWHRNDANPAKEAIEEVFEEIHGKHEVFKLWIEACWLENQKHLEEREARPF